MGMVWRARDKELNRDVALKFLPEALMSDDKAVLGLKKETKNALELSTHRVVRIHDFITDGRMAGISMEYVDGLSLAKRAGKQPEGSSRSRSLRCGWGSCARR
jgi:serine/threonine protein kinase